MEPYGMYLAIGLWSQSPDLILVKQKSTLGLISIDHGFLLGYLFDVLFAPRLYYSSFRLRIHNLFKAQVYSKPMIQEEFK